MRKRLRTIVYNRNISIETQKRNVNEKNFANNHLLQKHIDSNTKTKCYEKTFAKNDLIQKHIDSNTKMKCYEKKFEKNH